MNRVVIRHNEYCPECGALNSLRKRKSTVVNGARRILARCVVCGENVTIIYRDRPSKAEKVPDGDPKS